MTYTVSPPVRYKDLDPRKHVNHAVYVTLFEEGKAAYYRDILGVGLDEASTVVRSLDLEYLGPIALGDTVTVEVSVTNIGETSFTMAYRVFADGELAATGTTVSVCMNDEVTESILVPDEWRQRIAAEQAETESE